MTEEMFNSIVKWQKDTFPKADCQSKLWHLKDELEELAFATSFGTREESLPEFADCFILLFGAASIYGMSYNDILEAIYHKMEINKNRKWGEPDENGVVKHIK